MIWHPSPNFGARRDGLRPELVVLHYTAMESCPGALKALCDPEREVSAHYLISEAGEVYHLVAEEMRAWHAGAGAWGGRGDVNSRSIGIELANDGYSPFVARQMDALEQLLAGIFRRWAIRPDGVIGHSDMAPGRKIDPGLRFDWQRLARSGLSVWPSAETAGGPAPDTGAFLTSLGEFGYSEMAPDLALDVFRLRFRPRVKGPLDSVDMRLAQDLARRWPIDRTGAQV